MLSSEQKFNIYNNQLFNPWLREVYSYTEWLNLLEKLNIKEVLTGG